jgi:quercetin dioxygenase-like cupin family protein
MSKETEPKAALWFLQNLLLVLVRGKENGGHLGLIEFLGPPGDQPPPHVHNAQDEGFYVIEGEVTLFLPDREIVIREGEFCNAPRGVPHTYRITSDTNARWLVTSVPAGVEVFLEEYGRPAEELRLPEPEAPEVERLVAICKKQDIEILGPPGVLPKDLAAAS